MHTSAVPVEHEQIRAAKRLGLRVLSRPACLAELMSGTRTVAVAGSHGKSSTTWMLGHLLVQHEADPVVMVGGAIGELGGGARIGASDLFIAEVDESDGGFQHVAPQVAVVTNLEAEHIRHYGSFAALCEAFRAWLAGMGPDGVAILPTAGLDPRVDADLPCRIIRVGIDAGDLHCADLRLAGERSVFTLVAGERRIEEVVVPSPGRHMVENALCAIAAAWAIDPELDPRLLTGCERVRRRFTVHGECDGVRIVEDYGHHPTEIRAAVAAAALAGGRVHALFQPHRYTRSADCFHDFCAAFDEAGAVAVVPVYAAGEEPIAGVGGRDLAEGIAGHRDTALSRHRHDQVQYAPDAHAGAAFLSAMAAPGDTILVLGAGDIGAVCQDILAEVKV